MSLLRRIILPDAPKTNVWDIETKQIVFTGDTKQVSIFLNISAGSVSGAIARKGRIQKKYALRNVKSTI